jgi:hypothetical protein
MLLIDFKCGHIYYARWVFLAIAEGAVVEEI